MREANWPFGVLGVVLSQIAWFPGWHTVEKACQWEGTVLGIQEAWKESQFLTYFSSCHSLAAQNILTTFPLPFLTAQPAFLP